MQVEMRIIEFLSKLAKSGKTFTFEEAHRILQIERRYLRKVLYRFEKKGLIERVSKGKYVIIPLEGEKGEYTLHEFIIGSLIVNPYAIAYWSALHHYGMTEQILSTVFIQTTSWKKKQEIEIFGVKYKIVRIKKDKFFGIRKEWIEDTQVNITDKEKTIIDCLDKPQYCGGIIEVAKALKQGNFSIEQLSVYATKMGNSGVIRRLGYLCDLFNIPVELPKVDVKNYLYLDPTMPKKGFKNAKWRLIVNIEEKGFEELE